MGHRLLLMRSGTTLVSNPCLRTTTASFLPASCTATLTGAQQRQGRDAQQSITRDGQVLASRVKQLQPRCHSATVQRRNGATSLLTLMCAHCTQVQDCTSQHTQCCNGCQTPSAMRTQNYAPCVPRPVACGGASKGQPNLMEHRIPALLVISSTPNCKSSHMA